MKHGSILCDSSTSRKVLGKILSAKHLGMSQSFWDSVTVINSFPKRDAFCSDGWQQSCTITPTISALLPRLSFFILKELIDKKSPSIEKNNCSRCSINKKNVAGGCSSPTMANQHPWFWTAPKTLPPCRVRSAELHLEVAVPPSDQSQCHNVARFNRWLQFQKHLLF